MSARKLKAVERAEPPAPTNPDAPAVFRRATRHLRVIGGLRFRPPITVAKPLPVEPVVAPAPDQVTPSASVELGDFIVQPVRRKGIAERLRAWRWGGT